MATRNFSSIGGFAVGSTEVLDTAYALKNISATHMVSDKFTDANKFVYITKRVTNAGSNTLRLSLDGNTNLASNTPALANNSVSFINARIFGQETTTNTYVYATTLDLIVTTNGSGVSTIASKYENVIRQNTPGQEIWSVTPVAFQISGNPYFSFDVTSVTSTSTVKWIGILEILRVS